ncbi:hypothetical protein [Vibrio phage vB_VpaS_CHI]|nr:hypothetical protein [Vibrio phage vB_VpaS_ALK]USL90150.1 hypothetical protein [Vibrio phage vB_VpaS_CHI]
MIVQRVFPIGHDMLWSIAQAEKSGNPINIGDDWLWFKSFTQRGGDIVVTFEKVDSEPVSHDDAEAKLREALANL